MPGAPSGTEQGLRPIPGLVRELNVQKLCNDWLGDLAELKLPMVPD